MSQPPPAKRPRMVYDAETEKATPTVAPNRSLVAYYMSQQRLADANPASLSLMVCGWVCVGCVGVCGRGYVWVR